MTKKILIIVFLLFGIISLNADNDLFDEGIRFLKLGNTYREAKDYDKATDYINQGKKLVSQDTTWNAKYWTAVSNEFYGYLFRDINMPDLAVEYFEKAIKQYSSIIVQTDGSQVALEPVLESIRTLKYETHIIENPKPQAIAGEPVVNMDNLKLKAMPGLVSEHTENLSMAFNKFKAIPAGVFNLENLRYLNLSNNKIKEASGSFDALKKLHYLDLSNNKIKTISDEIGELGNLKELDLSDNSLKLVPQGLCNLKQLEVLNLRGNKIKFEQIKNLIQCLPHTNIIHDEYILKEKDKSGEALYME
jgi:tetratricopeptide (TPR) repeat protein